MSLQLDHKSHVVDAGRSTTKQNRLPFLWRRKSQRSADFVVFCMGRTGSTHLAGLLNSHPQICCEGELFPVEGNGALVNNYGPGREKGAAPGNRNWPADQKMDYLRELKACCGKRVFGFKYTWEMLEHDPDLFERFKKSGTQFIVLERRNTLDHYLSMRLAQVNNNWSSFDPYATQCLELVAAELLAFHRDHVFKYFVIDKLVAGCPHILVDYDQLLASPGIPLVQKFLGVGCAALASPYRRSRTRSQREIIANFHAIARQLQGTPLESFLES